MSDLVPILKSIVDGLISWQTLVLAMLISQLLFWVRNPEKFEKFVALVHRYGRHFWKSSEYAYVKYDIQGKINDYIAFVRHRVTHLTAAKAVVKWVNTATDEQTFISDGKIVIRMRKSDNQNKNLVNACVAFVSHSFLRNAKTYLANYQRQAIDLYVCYDLLHRERRDILNQFIDDFLRKEVQNEKTSSAFEALMEIDNASLFYPVFVQEISYLGEKVFLKPVKRTEIHQEVSGFVRFLRRFANRRVGDDSVPSEFYGSYSCFALRIIGKSFKMHMEGSDVYVRHLKNLPGTIETLYLLGSAKNVSFVREVESKFNAAQQFDVIKREKYDSVIKDPDGRDKRVRNYMVVLRRKQSKSIEPGGK